MKNIQTDQRAGDKIPDSNLKGNMPAQGPTHPQDSEIQQFIKELREIIEEKQSPNCPSGDHNEERQT
jgi:hypothetical protein